MPEEKPLILQYADMIAAGKWKSFTETQDARTIADNVEDLCHAALLSKNAGQAVKFLHALYSETTEALQPEQYALLKQTMERAEAVAERGGWQEIAATEAQEPIKTSFPAHTFPPEIEKYLDNVAKRSQVRREMVYPAALAALALCTQGKYMVEYPDATQFRQHLCLYIGIVADPSERKSPVFQSVIKKPFFRWYSTAKSAYAEELAQYKAKRKVLQKQLEAAEKGCTKQDKACSAVDDMAGLEAALDALQPPKNPNCLFDDTTPEALALCLKEAGESGGIFSEEGDFMETITGRYADKGKSANSELLLKAHDGETVRINRVSRGELLLERPLLSVCLMLQPELYRRIIADKTLQGRGGVARFLFCAPEKTTGSRLAINNEHHDMSGYSTYEAILHKFLDMELCEDGEMPVLRFDHALCCESSCIGQYLQWIENTMQDGGAMAEESAYAGKAGGKVVRIAGILHLLWGYDQNTPISAETAKLAVQVHKYFFAEKLREMQQTEQQEQNRANKVKHRLYRLTIEHGKPCIGVREAYIKMKGNYGLQSVSDFEGVLELLESENSVEQLQNGKKKIIYISPFLIIP